MIRLRAHVAVPVEIATKSLHTTLLVLGEVAFPIDGFSRYCLLNGLDQLGFLLESEAEIKAFEEARA